MNTQTIELHGRCVFWTLPEILDEAPVFSAFEGAGVSELMPPHLRPKTAMRRALKEHFPHDYRVEHVTSFDGFHVLQKHEDSNGKLSFPHRLTAFAIRMPETTDMVVIGRDNSPVGDHSNDAQIADIEQQYRLLRKSVTSGALGGALVSVTERLKGIPLRPSGGFYWIPQASIPTWEILAAGIQAAGGTLYSLTTGVDPLSVETLCAALEAKVQSELAQLDSALRDRSPGKRGLRTLQSRALEVNDLITTYQKLLGKTHDGILEQAADMEGEIAVALMAAESEA